MNGTNGKNGHCLIGTRETGSGQRAYPPPHLSIDFPVDPGGRTEGRTVFIRRRRRTTPRRRVRGRERLEALRRKRLVGRVVLKWELLSRGTE